VLFNVKLPILEDELPRLTVVLPKVIFPDAFATTVPLVIFTLARVKPVMVVTV
jgi:hypothetical protein